MFSSFLKASFLGAQTFENLQSYHHKLRKQQLLHVLCQWAAFAFATFLMSQATKQNLCRDRPWVASHVGQLTNKPSGQLVAIHQQSVSPMTQPPLLIQRHYQVAQDCDN